MGSPGMGFSFWSFPGLGYDCISIPSIAETRVHGKLHACDATLCFSLRKVCMVRLAVWREPLGNE